MAPLWMADAVGAFQEHQLTVAMSLIPGNTATNILISRDIDVVEQAIGPMIAANLNGGADIVFLASVHNRLPYALFVVPTIRTAADLKGKTLASDKPGTTNDLAMGLALSLLAVKREDVTLLSVGASDVGLAALLAGQVDGAILGLPQMFQAEAQGFISIQDTFNVLYQNTGIIALRSRVEELTPALTRFFPAYRQGIQAFKTQPELAQEVLRKYTQESDASVIQKTYAFFSNSAPFEDSLEPTLEGIQTVLDSVAPSIPSANSAKPADFIDTRFLAQRLKP
jgi:ABC-type nitrate/sulfonate/bicarbonate transport system substrate-binding protein